MQSNHPQVIKNTKAVVASFDTLPMDIGRQWAYAIQAKWTKNTTISGTIKLQASVSGKNWDDISGSAQTITDSGTYLWNVDAAAYGFVKVVFTFTSGSADFFIEFLSKCA